MPYDLFLGVPRHRAPDVVVSCGLTENGWIPVDQKTLATRFPGVFAIGDVTSVGTPKAGVFAEGAARTVAEILIARIKGGKPPAAFDGAGSCYLEFGRNQVGRVDVDFFSGASPTNMFNAPSAELSSEKTGLRTDPANEVVWSVDAMKRIYRPLGVLFALTLVSVSLYAQGAAPAGRDRPAGARAAAGGDAAAERR